MSWKRSHQSYSFGLRGISCRLFFLVTFWLERWGISWPAVRTVPWPDGFVPASSHRRMLFLKVLSKHNKVNQGDEEPWHYSARAGVARGRSGPFKKQIQSGEPICSLSWRSRPLWLGYTGPLNEILIFLLCYWGCHNADYLIDWCQLSCLLFHTEVLQCPCISSQGLDKVTRKLKQKEALEKSFVSWFLILFIYLSFTSLFPIGNHFTVILWIILLYPCFFY